jgi:hypothetical protein
VGTSKFDGNPKGSQTRLHLLQVGSSDGDMIDGQIGGGE